ncbi:MAG: glycoside hydrolase family 43 protein, partial [Armatimonadota bacterium]|nr:glycoside hydrolase family 43 protein [Armatimonadota bacterium]
MNTVVKRLHGSALLPALLFAVLNCAHAQEPPPTPVAAAPTLPGTFTNPVRRDAADPWIVYRNGFYYMTHTVGWGVAIRRALTLAGLGTAPEVKVWHGSGPGFETYTRDVWAPEMHFLDGKWYIYYCATDGPDPNRRVFVLESKTDDPQGEYVFKGKLAPTESDDYAIDPTVYQDPQDKLFLLWSGRPPGGQQTIFIAPMSNPWTISGPRVKLSSPEYDWEKHGWPVNEGPEVLRHGNKTLVFYSGSGYTTPEYALGMLTNTDGNLLNPTSWTKSPLPVFTQYQGPDGEVMGTG